MRHTVIVSGGHPAATRRLRAARQGEHGLQVLTIEQAALRLAGGFLRMVDGDTLARLAAEAVTDTSAVELGDLARIAELPGLPAALAATLDKVWQAGIDLEKEAWFRICHFWVTRAYEDRRPVRAGFRLEGCPVREAVGLLVVKPAGAEAVPSPTGSASADGRGRSSTRAGSCPGARRAGCAGSGGG